MRYILHYSGEVPKYAHSCIEAIKLVDKNSHIFLCGNKNPNIENVNFININDLSDTFIKEIDELGYFKNEENPLWETSLKRIFYLYNAAKDLKVDEFVHFDIDVLIYKPFSDIENLFHKNKLNITPANEHFLIFGYSYINGIENYKKICEKVYEIVGNSKHYEKKYYNNTKLNEMVMLNIAYIENHKMFNILNTIPQDNSNTIFDGISYGQYLSGVDGKRFSRKTINSSHFAGREMINQGYRPYFKNNKPEIKLKSKKIEIANLHVHKKNLSSFMPREYE
jgi:hypothetical protein